MEERENMFMDLVKEFKESGYGKDRIYQLVDVAFDGIKTLEHFSNGDSK